MMTFELSYIQCIILFRPLKPCVLSSGRLHAKMNATELHKLQIAPCFALPQFCTVSPHTMNSATYCISLRAASHFVLPRRYRYARLRRADAAFASPYHASRVRMRLTARVYRRKAIVGLAHPAGEQSASGMRRTYTLTIKRSPCFHGP